MAILSRPADAHPLGNFTINHLAVLEPSERELRVHYVLDIAEIPTFQIMRATSQRGTWDANNLASWAKQETAPVLDGLRIFIDDHPAVLRGGSAHARLRPGAGGLPILYWTEDFVTAAHAGARISIVDRVYADRRIGWKDIIVRPQTEPTRELQAYPSALIASPRTVTRATFAIAPAGNAVSIVRETTDIPQVSQSGSIVRQTMLSEMFLRPDQGPLWILLTILAAFAFGALHAIEPGHGKALLAFTLVGARATTKQAAILAASLTVAHTAGVILLGVVLFFAAGFVPETIYPWITLVSGIAIVLVGARALGRYVRSVQPFAHLHAHSHAGTHEHAHAHEHGSVHHSHALDAAHGHSHDHVHGHDHTHAIPGSAPLNFGSAVWAAMSGGIAPCPAAIILLIAAVNAHRVAYGLLLIIIFGMGLASVLTGLGIAVVHGAARISKNSRYERIVRFGPLASAVLISIIGAVLLGQGFQQIGAHVNIILVAALVLCAIAGYALSAHHEHRERLQPA